MINKVQSTHQKSRRRKVLQWLKQGMNVYGSIQVHTLVMLTQKYSRLYSEWHRNCGYTFFFKPSTIPWNHQSCSYFWTSIIPFCTSIISLSFVIRTKSIKNLNEQTTNDLSWGMRMCKREGTTMRNFIVCTVNLT